MGRHGTRPLYDRLLGGQLEAILRSYADANLSNEKIAFLLRSEYEIPVSSETVRRWLDDYNITKPVAS